MNEFELATNSLRSCFGCNYRILPYVCFGYQKDLWEREKLIFSIFKGALASPTVACKGVHRVPHPPLHDGNPLIQNVTVFWYVIILCQMNKNLRANFSSQNSIQLILKVPFPTVFSIRP